MTEGVNNHLNFLLVIANNKTLNSYQPATMLPLQSKHALLGL